ncbi:hypothetical protein T484DRAFT_1876991 [Baffinella frigidus]|nr:hypothetical protein T484DRAFT_1876991 [Cryptophyta sp. CCMP2293]
MEAPVAAQYAAVTYNKPRDTSSRRRVVLGALGIACVAAVALLAGGERGRASEAELSMATGRWASYASPQRNGWFSSMRRHDTPDTASGLATTDALSAARDALKVIATEGAPPAAPPAMIQPEQHQAAARMRVAAKIQRLAAAPPQQPQMAEAAPAQKLMIEAQHMFPWPPPPLQQVSLLA